MSIIIDTNIWPFLLGLFTVLLSSWYLQTHLSPCHTLKYTSTSCLSYNDWVISVQILLLMIYINYFHAHFWLTAKKKTIPGDWHDCCRLHYVLKPLKSSPRDIICGLGILNAQKGKTAWKRLSQSHGVALQLFIITMSQILLVYNG